VRLRTHEFLYNSSSLCEVVNYCSPYCEIGACYTGVTYTPILQYVWYHTYLYWSIVARLYNMYKEYKENKI
jgi:hypothetical protein